MNNEILRILNSSRNLVLDSNVNDDIFKCFLHGEDIDIRNIQSDSDRVLYFLNFVGNNFDAAICNNYIENILSFTEIKDNNLFYKIMIILKERIDKNVRKKI